MTVSGTWRAACRVARLRRGLRAAAAGPNPLPLRAAARADLGLPVRRGDLSLAEWAGGPGEAGAAAGRSGDVEGPAVVFRAAAHAGQAAGPGGGAEAAAVVGDLERDQPVLQRQGDGDGGGVGVTGAVGQGLAGDGQDVVGQSLVQVRAGRAGKADAGGEAELRGVIVDDLHDPGLQAGGGLAGQLEAEDAGADLLDHLIEGLDVAVDP